MSETIFLQRMEVIYMIKETDSCRYLYFLLGIRGWGIIKVDKDLDLCFVCFAGDGSLSGHGANKWQQQFI